MGAAEEGKWNDAILSYLPSYRNSSSWLGLLRPDGLLADGIPARSSVEQRVLRRFFEVKFEGGG